MTENTETGIVENIDTQKEGLSPEEIVEEEIVDDTGSDEIVGEEPEEEVVKDIQPKMKNKTQKRIVGLVKKGHEKDRAIEALEEKVKNLENENQNRSEKEQSLVHEAKLAELQAVQKEAMDEGDHDKFTKSQSEMFQYMQQSAPLVRNDNVNPDDYFKSKNNWYNVDRKRTLAAKQISSEIFNDSQFSHMTTSQKCDEVGRQVNALYKENGYRNSSPSSGASISQPSRGTVQVTQSDLAGIQAIYPGVSRAEQIKIAKEFKANIMAKEEA